MKTKQHKISSPSIDLINQTVINVLMHSVATNDLRTLDALGVNFDSVRRLEELSMKGRYLIGESPAPIIQTFIDNKALGLYTQRFISKEEERAFINKLIIADAPLKLLEVNFGIDKNDYAKCRDSLGLTKPRRGRPEVPEIQNCPKALSMALEPYILDESNIHEELELLLALSEKHTMTIRDVLAYFDVIAKEIK